MRGEGWGWGALPRAGPCAPSLVSRARPPLCSPSARRPLAGSGKGPSPEEAAGLRDPQPGQTGRAETPPRPPACLSACLSVCQSAGSESRASVSLAAAACSATTSAAYFRQLFLSTSAQPSPAQPAHAPRPYRVAPGSSLGSASREPIRAAARGGAWGGGGAATPPARPWKRMNGAARKASGGSGSKGRTSTINTCGVLALCQALC